MAEKGYCLQDGDSLPLVAENHGLPGWQTLYFAGCNLQFRINNPNPWNLPSGVVIRIPELTDEHRQILRWRMGMLQAITKDVENLLNEQLRLIGEAKLALAKGANSPMVVTAISGRVTTDMARTTLRAMHMLKFYEAGMSAQNSALVMDALNNWNSTDPVHAARLVTVLKRATDGIVWGIEPNTAQAWCDPNASFFWGVPLIRAINGIGSGNMMQLLKSLQGNLQNAGSSVLRELKGMRSAANSELGRLVNMDLPDMQTEEEDWDGDDGANHGCQL